MRKKDNLTYNASHAPDPTAKKAIEAADDMPKHIKGFLYAMKETAKLMNLRIENRIIIRDMDTNKVYK